MNVTWHIDTHDPAHIKRLAIGYAVGIGLVIAAVGVAATVRATVAPKEEEEQVVDVKLAATAEPPKPPPPPPPPPEAPKAQAPPGPAPRRAIVAPTAVPTEAPKESDKPVKPSRDDEYGDGKGGVIGGAAGGTGTALAPPPPAPSSAAPPPPPPPPPKAQGPVALTEDMTPPSALSTPAPAYPADARSQGVEATVVVRFTISETGEVQNPTIVRGHPLFDAAVLQAVKSWRYKPASLDGKPVAVQKTVRIPFSIKN